MHTDSALLIDDAFMLCDKRDLKFKNMYKYMLTDHIYEYSNTICRITAKDRKVFFADIIDFPSDAEKHSRLKGETRVVKRKLTCMATNARDTVRPLRKPKTELKTL
jgi:hypothetical protein